MVVLLGAANRDERRFPDGDHFDIHRNIDKHFSFGYGIHYCLGAALARLQGRIALEEILQRFPEWEIDVDNARRASSSTLRGMDAAPRVHPLNAPPRSGVPTRDPTGVTNCATGPACSVPMTVEDRKPGPTQQQPFGLDLRICLRNGRRSARTGGDSGWTDPSD